MTLIVLALLVLGCFGLALILAALLDEAEAQTLTDLERRVRGRR